MSEILATIRQKRADAIADMPEPIITLNLREVNELFEHIDSIEEDKKTLMNDLAMVNIQLGKDNEV